MIIVRRCDVYGDSSLSDTAERRDFITVISVMSMCAGRYRIKDRDRSAPPRKNPTVLLHRRRPVSSSDYETFERPTLQNIRVKVFL